MKTDSQVTGAGLSQLLLIAGVGVYISRVEEGSVAERAGLRPGDTILEVNGTPFSTISHEEALKVGGFTVSYFEFFLSPCTLVYSLRCLITTYNPQQSTAEGSVKHQRYLACGRVILRETARVTVSSIVKANDVPRGCS
jgi:hypothetical protein